MSTDQRPIRPDRLKNLIYRVRFPGGNTLLHKFVLDHSSPNQLVREPFLRGVLLSMRDIPVDVANAINDDHDSALHLAVFQNNHMMVRMLLSCLDNIEVNTLPTFVTPHTPLTLAAEKGHIKIVDELLQKGARVDLPNYHIETALYLALRGGYLDVAELLIRAGTNVNVMGSPRGTPLEAAAGRGHLKTLQFLVRLGANVNLAGLRTPLISAVRSRCLEAVQYLISEGAEINRRDRFLNSPLHTAISIEDLFLNSPLHTAISIEDNLETIEYLIKNGADLHMRDPKGETPLHRVAKMGHFYLMDYLLSNGADINAQDSCGQTPLHHAAQTIAFERVTFLLDRGADVNAKDRHSETPLHWAVKKRNVETFRFLKFVTHSDVMLEAHFHMFQLLVQQEELIWYLSDENLEWHSDYYSQVKGHSKVIRLLLGRGANMNAVNEDGHSPVDLARKLARIHTLNNFREFLENPELYLN